MSPEDGRAHIRDILATLPFSGRKGRLVGHPYVSEHINRGAALRLLAAGPTWLPPAVLAELSSEGIAQAHEMGVTKIHAYMHMLTHIHITYAKFLAQTQIKKVIVMMMMMIIMKMMLMMMMIGLTNFGSVEAAILYSFYFLLILCWETSEERFALFVSFFLFFP